MDKKEALTQFHKDAIADAADRLFQKNGVEKTTVDDIARQAEYSKRTLYVYFQSKDKIYYYIVQKAMNMLHTRICAGISADSDPIKQYYAICGELASFAEEYPFYYKSLTDTIAADPISRGANPTLEDIYRIGERINQLIQAVLDNGIKQGVFQSDSMGMQMGIFCWAALSGIILLANNKAQYIQQNMGLSKDAFLNYSFQTLLKAILSERETSNA